MKLFDTPSQQYVDFDTHRIIHALEDFADAPAGQSISKATSSTIDQAFYLLGFLKDRPAL